MHVYTAYAPYCIYRETKHLSEKAQYFLEKTFKMETTKPYPVQNNDKEEDEMQLIPMLQLCFRLFVRNWKWFLLSVCLCVCIGWFYQQRQPRILQRQSVMLIEDSDGGSTSSVRRSTKRNSMNTLLELNGVSVGDNLKNEIFILSSKRLMLRVVQKLRLEVDYTVKENLHDVTLYGKTRPFEVLFQRDYKGKFAQDITVSKKNATTLTLSGMTDRTGEEVAPIDVKLGQMVQTPYGNLCVVRGEAFDKWTGGEPVRVTRLSQDNAAARFLGTLSVAEYDKETSLIVLSCSDTNKDRADQILATLFDTYKEDVVENKNRVAQNTAKFIDERIDIISRELSSVESQLANFKKRNQLVDFEKTSQEVLSQTSSARQQSLQAETQLNVARYLDEYLHSHSNTHDLIPALSISDASFNQQIATFNDQMNKRNQMAANSSEATAMVRELDRQLAQMRQAIVSSLRSYVSSLEVRLRDAKANEAQLTGRIAGAPDQEKQGLDIQRQQSLKEALYTYLLNKREEVALQQAINEANVRLVEGPVGNKQVSPRSLIIIGISFLLGLLIPALIIWLRRSLDVSVHSRRDVEAATTIPVLGEIPSIDKKESDRTLITDFDSDAAIVEAFRILRFSLGYMRHATQVMMATSTTPGQGKSFVARNMAIILAMAGKKVVVIDADIRKRTLSNTFGHASGLTTYLADDDTVLADIIKRDVFAQGVDFIPAGHMPPNPSELLMSDNLEKLVNELRKQYDYVIFDTTPMFSVADASIVNRVVEITLFVIRAGVQNRDFLPDLETINQDNRFKKLCVIVNDVKAFDNYHTDGYGYGYGYGYNAGREKKNGRVKRILNRLHH